MTTAIIGSRSGNDTAANNAVAELMERQGFAAIDLGRLEQGSRLQQPLGAPDAIRLIRIT
jgi:predicted dinucleotide-binding enzyme